MTRLEHVAELAGDIRDCAMRARDLGFPAEADGLHGVADALTKQPDRPSLPPVLASNQEVRAAASRHFQETQRILKGIKPCSSGCLPLVSKSGHLATIDKSTLNIRLTPTNRALSSGYTE